MSEIHVQHNPDAHRFEINLEGQTAVLDYERTDNALRFPRTVVPKELGGRGLAKRLVLTGLQYAKEHELGVIPACSFVHSYIEKHPEWQDLVVANDPSVDH